MGTESISSQGHKQNNVNVCHYILMKNNMKTLNINHLFYLHLYLFTLYYTLYIYVYISFTLTVTGHRPESDII